MSKRCNHIRENGFRCGSYAFNLWSEGVEQGNLCDVHYWQDQAQVTQKARAAERAMIAEQPAKQEPVAGPEYCQQCHNSIEDLDNDVTFLQQALAVAIIVSLSEHLQSKQVEDIYKQAWVMLAEQSAQQAS